MFDILKFSEFPAPLSKILRTLLGATSSKLRVAKQSMVRKEKKKNTSKMKPHRVWKLFQVTAGHSMKIITNNLDTMKEIGDNAKKYWYKTKIYVKYKIPEI